MNIKPMVPRLRMPWLAAFLTSSLAFACCLCMMAATSHATGAHHKASHRAGRTAHAVQLPRPSPAAAPSVPKASPTADTLRLADWILSTHNSEGWPFVIIDKKQAQVFVFASDGKLRGASPALLGKVQGDAAAPGIGTRTLKTILPSEKITPAGRFAAVLGRDLDQAVLWLDYEDALSLHPVVMGDQGDRRHARLATPSIVDNRITYGCVNVPKAFFDNVVLPTSEGSWVIVYILPETGTVDDVFFLTGAKIDPLPGHAVPKSIQRPPSGYVRSTTTY